MYKTIFALLLSLSLFGCQIQPLDVHYAGVAASKITSATTFTVEAHSSINADVIRMLNKGIEKTLTGKGYQKAEGSSAQLLVIYQVKLIEDTEFRTEAAPEGRIVKTYQKLEPVFEAKLLTNVVDTKTKQVLWKASSIKDLTQVNTKEFSQDRADERMEELFTGFPSRSFSLY